MKIIGCNKEPLLFFEFLIENGFNPNNYKNILELNNSVSESISKYINKYPQFLLSSKVEYNELLKYNVKGARGWIEEKTGIVVPKTVVATEYFRKINSENKSQRHIFDYPGISDFNSVIAYHNWTQEDLKQIISILNYPTENYYIGFMTEFNDINLKEKLEFYRLILKVINETAMTEHELVYESIRSKNKKLYLIRKKDN